MRFPHSTALNFGSRKSQLAKDSSSEHLSTPPCCDALVKAGCGRVVIGMSDPAPWVSGNGARRLREGGVDVEVLEDAACLELLEGWVASLNLEGK